MSTAKIITHKGFWYRYDFLIPRVGIDYCLATNEPEQYCNGIYKYKDKLDKKEFVILDTNNPELKKMLIHYE